MVNEIQKQIYEAINSGDCSLALMLLEENPSELNTRLVGSGWLGRAATTDGGNVEMFRALIEFGLPTDPEGVRRTALSLSVQSSSVEVIECLLEYGADPNAGRTIIGAVNRKQDALVVLKLLVKHGVEVNQIYELEGTTKIFTALDWAKDPVVIEYLKSVGAKKSSVLEFSNPNAPAPPVSELQEVTDFFEEVFGSVDPQAMVQIVPTGLPISIHVIRASSNREYLTLFTSGLSLKPMNTPRELDEYSYAELFIQLPIDWDLESVDRKWTWPMEWLRRIAQYPHNNNVCLGGEVTILANENPPEPLGPGVSFTSFLLLADKSFTRNDGKRVQLYRVVPIYSDERNLEIESGTQALLEAFDQTQTTLVVDPERPSVAPIH